ncbi:hypothetical protein WM40_11255 [Robbsia andropogonis]|uniref:DUF3619 domain-containing protein n=1 Tax=Robbsia andropogonis TaxID=28092 RepID=A0A0F5K0G1_9BURK|nr:DUF3619 family protein [Robbsia andropogonis]KKB63563.1 hypothetical protein WM40_11255 [Robbsia andropogonis]MCP1116780.1 DUF3619 family protein [Robbsia andropogonis]MCP1126541.1 DUF3619 family protein [Robbsia andropogonis]
MNHVAEPSSRASRDPLNEAVFAYKVRRALDEGARALPNDTTARLAAARRMALARKKPETAAAPVPTFVPALAGAGMGSLPGLDSARGPRPFRVRLQLWVPIALLLASLAAIAHWEDQRQIAELASLDAEVLSDTLPLDAYLDHGFNEYLARNR